jgi:hypothetical protein
MIFWLIFALRFIAWGFNGLGVQRNTRIMLRVALTPLLAPLLAGLPLLLLTLTGLGLWRAFVTYPALTSCGCLAVAILVYHIHRTRRLRRP